MASSSRSGSPPQYSSRVLAETPAKVAQFLDALGRHSLIRISMAGVGMQEAERLEGASLFNDYLINECKDRPVWDTTQAEQQQAALRTLDAWEEPNFTRYQATLRRHHPSAGAYIFHKLKAGQGTEAITNVATFLIRVQALEQGSEVNRRKSWKDDKAAVKLLAKRGLDAAERQRLQDLVDRTLQATPVSDVDVFATEKRYQARRQQALVALKQWYDEWSTAARTVITNRNHLIYLGLGKRKPPRSQS